MINYNQRDIADNPLISVMIEFPSSRNGNVVRTPVVGGTKCCTVQHHATVFKTKTPGKIWLFPDSLEFPMLIVPTKPIQWQPIYHSALNSYPVRKCSASWNRKWALGAFTDWLHGGFLWKLHWLIPYLDVTRISRSVVSSWVNTAYYSSNNWITGMSWDITANNIYNNI